MLQAARLRIQLKKTRKRTPYVRQWEVKQMKKLLHFLMTVSAMNKNVQAESKNGIDPYINKLPMNQQIAIWHSLQQARWYIRIIGRESSSGSRMPDCCTYFAASRGIFTWTQNNQRLEVICLWVLRKRRSCRHSTIKWIFPLSVVKTGQHWPLVCWALFGDISWLPNSYWSKISWNMFH